MLKGLSYLLIFFHLSCSSVPKLSKVPIDSLLNSIKLTGEGRGRLGVKQRQGVFSYDAVLNEKGDWLLAMSVPMHGETVLLFPKIKELEVRGEQQKIIEKNIEKEIANLMGTTELSGQDYVRQLRSMIRFILAPELALSRHCMPLENDQFECKQGSEIYNIDLKANWLKIKKVVSKDLSLELWAENYHQSYFKRTSFYLKSHKATHHEPAFLSLELFWH
jgi:hypothetical protein